MKKKSLNFIFSELHSTYLSVLVSAYTGFPLYAVKVRRGAEDFSVRREPRSHTLINPDSVQAA